MTRRSDIPSRSITITAGNVKGHLSNITIIASCRDRLSVQWRMTIQL